MGRSHRSKPPQFDANYIATHTDFSLYRIGYSGWGAVHAMPLIDIAAFQIKQVRRHTFSANTVNCRRCCSSFVIISKSKQQMSSSLLAPMVFVVVVVLLRFIGDNDDERLDPEPVLGCLAGWPAAGSSYDP